ncbi:MAG: disulfide bond formation protein B [Legionella sp.]|nr:disulfide bond formation protein B [Legionella sp.]
MYPPTNNPFNYKRFQTFLALISIFILLSSFYFQYVKHLEPCPLCLMQRLSVFCLALISLCAIFLKRFKVIKSVAILQIIFASAGLFFASRQLWLQFLPAGQTAACMPELDVLLQYFPWSDIAHAFFWGSSNCAEHTWQWLGLPMPGWSLAYFALMLLANIRLLFIKRVSL